MRAHTYPSLLFIVSHCRWIPYRIDSQQCFKLTSAVWLAWNGLAPLNLQYTTDTAGVVTGSPDTCSESGCSLWKRTCGQGAQPGVERDIKYAWSFNLSYAHVLLVGAFYWACRGVQIWFDGLGGKRQREMFSGDWQIRLFFYSDYWMCFWHNLQNGTSRNHIIIPQIAIFRNFAFILYIWRTIVILSFILWFIVFWLLENMQFSCYASILENKSSIKLEQMRVGTRVFYFERTKVIPQWTLLSLFQKDIVYW